jgi:hypothetical protein
LQTDGFTIQAKKDILYIKGGREKGVLYGVYTFFDKYLNYRCYSPSVFNYPTLSKVRIPANILDTQIPMNVYRNVYYEVADDPFYADWHKLDHMKPDWGMWVHTFSTLIPVDNYFSEHPEYFALVNGQRVAKQHDETLSAQLCLSNPDVLRIVVENLEKRMEDNSKSLYWSVSQNDTYPNLGYNCTCDKCTAIDKESGNPSGSLITFVNKVAAHFPDKIISTLAYRYSRSAPSAVKPDSNVNIMLCNIECNRNLPIADDTTSVDFCKDFKDWTNLTNNILIWDYVVQFTNLLAPFPNLRILQPNMQYYVQHGVNAHFQQGNISRGGEFCELRPYLIARLLWDPHIDFEAELKDFLKGYYEEAAPFIEKYINLMHDELERSGQELKIFGSPYDHFETGFMRLELTQQYEKIFDEAEKAVASKPEVLERVQVARLPQIYSLFEFAKIRGTKETRVFEMVNGKWQVQPKILQELKYFTELCNKTGVQLMQERQTTPNEYYEQTKNFLLHITNKTKHK